MIDFSKVILTQAVYPKTFNSDKKHYHPAGRIGWEWTWMGLTPPQLIYSENPLDKSYNKFTKCFGEFYGIGEFEYWISEELNKLSENDKIELINLRLEHEKFNEFHRYKNREYIGLIDGKINNSIDPYSESYKFYKILTVEECENSEYPHNPKQRYSDGFYCEACNTFFDITSDTYIKSVKFSNIHDEIRNFSVYFSRAQTTLPPEWYQIDDLCNEIYNLPEKQRNVDEINLLGDTLNLLNVIYSSIITKEN